VKEWNCLQIICTPDVLVAVQRGLRKSMAEKELTKDDFFVPDNHVAESDEEHLSPSGKYKLTIQTYNTSKASGECSWEYTAGVVEEVATGKQIAEVRRNYRSFWHLWLVQAEKEYLLCGEDYQGYGYVDPQTGKSEFYLPDAADNGNGFCFVKMKQTAPDRVMVHGCIWACPFEVHTYDVSDPLTLPYPQIERRDCAGDFDPDFGGKEESLNSPEHGESNRQFFLENEHRWRQSALVIVKNALRRYLNDEHIYTCQQHQKEHGLKPEDMHCNCKRVIVDYALNAAVLLSLNMPLMPSIFEDARYYTHAESGEDYDQPLSIEGQEELDAELIREVYRSSKHSQPIKWSPDGSK
jgi:hypothetical protein